MPSLRRFLQLSPRYFRRFGPFTGADILLRTIVAKLVPSGRSVPVRVPGLRSTLELRARTSDVKVFDQVFVEREHDIKSVTGSAMTIVDAGANVGFSSVFFATEYPQARVIAIEPEKSNYEQLVRNAAAYPNIVPVHAALWSTRGVVRIANPDAQEWAFRVDAVNSGQAVATIPAVAVSDVIAQYGLKHVDILKIDIEGAETEVFGASAADWLPRVGHIMIELHDYLKPGCSTATRGAVERAGFTHTMQHGEYTVFSRKSLAPPA
jgi:FkbM family methyltransferase